MPILKYVHWALSFDDYVFFSLLHQASIDLTLLLLMLFVGSLLSKCGDQPAHIRHTIDCSWLQRRIDNKTIVEPFTYMHYPWYIDLNRFGQHRRSDFPPKIYRIVCFLYGLWFIQSWDTQFKRHDSQRHNKICFVHKKVHQFSCVSYRENS